MRSFAASEPGTHSWTSPLVPPYILPVSVSQQQGTEPCPAAAQSGPFFSHSELAWALDLGKFLAHSAPPCVLFLLASGCRELLFPASPLATGVAASMFSLHHVRCRKQEHKDGCCEHPDEGEDCGLDGRMNAASRSALLGLPLGFAGHSHSSRSLPPQLYSLLCSFHLFRFIYLVVLPPPTPHQCELPELTSGSKQPSKHLFT